MKPSLALFVPIYTSLLTALVAFDTFAIRFFPFGQTKNKIHFNISHRMEIFLPGFWVVDNRLEEKLQEY